MPKHEPSPIHIRIDTQEQRSGIPTPLAVMPQVDSEVITLRKGDYDVRGDPHPLFERNSGNDFLSSLAQGHLFAQMAALRRSRFAPILLLEGDPLGVDHLRMPPESIRGALCYIAVVMRVPILPEPRTNGFRAPGLCCSKTMPGRARGSPPFEMAARSFSTRAAYADRAVTGRYRPRHGACATAPC